MVTLHLVRHGRPAVDPSAPAPTWKLDPAGVGAVRALGESVALPRDALWASSPEPKALATARLLTDGEVLVDERLREAGREGPFLAEAEFRRRVLESLTDMESASAPGWEPLRQTGRRVLDAAGDLVRAAGARDVVLVGHGTAFTVLVALLTGEPPDTEAWQAMRMPDHCAVRLRDNALAEVVSPWGAWPG